MAGFELANVCKRDPFFFVWTWGKTISKHRLRLFIHLRAQILFQLIAQEKKGMREENKTKITFQDHYLMVV